MEKEKIKSFRLSSDTTFDNTGFGNPLKKGWWKFRKMSRAEYRNTAGLCIGLGVFFMPVLIPVGIIAGIIWIYKVIRKQE